MGNSCLRNTREAHSGKPKTHIISQVQKRCMESHDIIKLNVVLCQFSHFNKQIFFMCGSFHLEHLNSQFHFQLSEKISMINFHYYGLNPVSQRVDILCIFYISCGPELKVISSTRTSSYCAINCGFSAHQKIMVSLRHKWGFCVRQER